VDHVAHELPSSADLTDWMSREGGGRGWLRWFHLAGFTQTFGIEPSRTTTRVREPAGRRAGARAVPVREIWPDGKIDADGVEVSAEARCGHVSVS